MPARETMTRGKETGKKIKPVAPPSDVAGPAKETSETTLKVSADGIFHSRSPFTPPHNECSGDSSLSSEIS